MVYHATSMPAICSSSFTQAQLSSSGKSEIPDWNSSWAALVVNFSGFLMLERSGPGLDLR